MGAATAGHGFGGEYGRLAVDPDFGGGRVRAPAEEHFDAVEFRPVHERRVVEISADLYKHITYEQGRGAGERRIALGVLSRMVRGLAADASWRNRIRPWRKDITKSSTAKFAAAVAQLHRGAAP